MRRKDREVTDPEAIDAIVSKALICHLGLFDEGYPYVVPLHYGYEWSGGAPGTGDLVLYFHGAREGHKLDLIRADAHACVEMECDVRTLPSKVACGYGAAYASVIGRGAAEVVEDADEKVHGLELLMRAQTGRDFSIPKLAAKTVAVIKVVVPAGQLTAKRRPLPKKDRD